MKARQTIMILGVLMGFLFVVMAGCSCDCDVLEPTPTPIPQVPTSTPLPQGWYGWWGSGSKADWPSRVGDLRVGYVLVGSTTPLYEANEDGVAVVYENIDLRDNSSSTNTNSRRIIAKSYKWLMVLVGDEYGLGDPRPTILDGGNPFYIVMHEQIVDGIELWTVPDLPVIYIPYRDIIERHMP